MSKDRHRYLIRCGQFSFSPPCSPEEVVPELRTSRLRLTVIEKVEFDKRGVLEIVVYSTDLMSFRLDPNDLSTILIPVSRNH